jgi:hypothetical protein
VGVHAFVLAGIALLIGPAEAFLGFMAGWADDAGDTGVPPPPGVEDRLIASFILIGSAAALACAVLLTMVVLRASERGFTTRRVMRALAFVAVAFQAAAFICLR